MDRVRIHQVYEQWGRFISHLQQAYWYTVRAHLIKTRVALFSICIFPVFLPWARISLRTP